MSEKIKPVVYACSGCSNLAQMANELALSMDRDGIAEMSCISGVIGKVQPIMDMVKNDRSIIVIDGCCLGCTKACVDACGLVAEHYFVISKFGFEKRSKEEHSFNESCVALRLVYKKLIESGYSLDSVSANLDAS